MRILGAAFLLALFAGCWFGLGIEYQKAKPQVPRRACGSHLLDCPDARWFDISYFAQGINMLVKRAEIGVCTNCWQVVGSGVWTKNETVNP